MQTYLTHTPLIHTQTSQTHTLAHANIHTHKYFCTCLCVYIFKTSQVQADAPGFFLLFLLLRFVTLFSDWEKPASYFPQDIYCHVPPADLPARRSQSPKLPATSETPPPSPWLSAAGHAAPTPLRASPPPPRSTSSTAHVAQLGGDTRAGRTGPPGIHTETKNARPHRPSIPDAVWAKKEQE